jgi:hypothetical protein
MHEHNRRPALLTWALLFLALLPGELDAQLRSVVSNEIAVSSREATLHLEFGGQESLTIALTGGEVLVNGDPVGAFERGGELDLAWRSLLGRVIALDDGPLAEALDEWTPPSELEGSAADVAQALDKTLEGALALPQTPQGESGGAEITLTLGDEGSLLRALLTRTGALQGLGEAIGEAALESFTLRIGEDVEIEAGEEIDRSLIVVDGDLDLRGTVRGDVVVTDGTVRLREGARVTGDLRVADGHVETMGGEVEGSILDLDTGDVVTLDDHEIEKLREELERDIRRDLRASMDRRGGRSGIFTGIFGNVGRAIAELLENLLTLFVLVILGVFVVHFGKERLEVVANTARRAPAQSAMVGLAGGFLLIPVWILGVVALAISIIGIPLLLAWVPLFPLAVALAGLLGYVAVARNVGEWVADQEYRGLEWIRGSNTFYVVVAGLGALMLPAIAASAIRILGLGFLHGLLTFVGGAITFTALAIGFGAVLLTRGGRIRPYAAHYEFEEEFWSEEGSETPPTEEAGSEEAFSESQPVPEGETGGGQEDPGEPSDVDGNEEDEPDA